MSHALGWSEKNKAYRVYYSQYLTLEEKRHVKPAQFVYTLPVLNGTSLGTVRSYEEHRAGFQTGGIS